MTGCCCCFPPTAKVLTTVGYVSIVDLTPNHTLLVNKKNGAGFCQTKFCTYLHFDPKLEAEFLVLRCANNSELIISASHLLYSMRDGKSKVVAASSISVGDSLIFINENNEKVSHPKVVEITSKMIEGVYAPLSDNGTIIVNGFKTSCYAEIESHKLAHASLAPLRFWSVNRNLLQCNDKRIIGKVNEIHPYARMLSAIRRICM